MAYRVRFYMDMNAREAMHLIELRTAPQGHPSYRRICQLMHRAIVEVAGHRAIGEAMQFVDHSKWNSSGCSRNARSRRSAWRRLAAGLASSLFFASSASTRRGTSANRSALIRSKNRMPSR